MRAAAFSGLRLVRSTKITSTWVASDLMNQPVWNKAWSAWKTSSNRPKVFAFQQCLVEEKIPGLEETPAAGTARAGMTSAEGRCEQTTAAEVRPGRSSLDLGKGVAAQ